MFTEFKLVQQRSFGAILGWGLSLGALGLMIVSFFDTISEQREALEQMIAAYPPEIMAFFGGTENIFTPAGFLSQQFFSYMPIILGIYAIAAASGLIVGDEENGVLDLVMAYPLSRSALFFGRFLAYTASLLLILFIAWTLFAAGLPATESMNVSAWELALPMIALFAIVFLFGSLTLLLSMILPSRATANMVGGLFMVGSFFIHSLSGMIEQLEQVAKVLPFFFYQSGNAIEGLNMDWTLGLLAASLIFTASAWALFIKRDVRVSGEGNFKLAFWRK